STARLDMAQRSARGSDSWMGLMSRRRRAPYRASDRFAGRIVDRPDAPGLTIIDDCIDCSRRESLTEDEPGKWRCAECARAARDLRLIPVPRATPPPRKRVWQDW